MKQRDKVWRVTSRSSEESGEAKIWILGIHKFGKHQQGRTASESARATAVGVGLAAGHHTTGVQRRQHIQLPGSDKRGEVQHKPQSSGSVGRRTSRLVLAR